jgi:uncharacterized membrane protein
MYTEDAKQFTNIIQRYNLLRENDTMSAYTLMKDSLQVFNRWSEIREEITKSLKRGEDSAVKKRLEDKLRILIEIHTDARIIFNRSKKEMDFVREE